MGVEGLKSHLKRVLGNLGKRQNLSRIATGISWEGGDQRRGLVFDGISLQPQITLTMPNTVF
jgi:hypothetical protein